VRAAGRGGCAAGRGGEGSFFGPSLRVLGPWHRALFTPNWRPPQPTANCQPPTSQPLPRYELKQLEDFLDGGQGGAKDITEARDRKADVVQVRVMWGRCVGGWV
jgi:hypothetical protein